jgi:ribosomal protein L12E/L44/L45/RPP1/RPP2
MATNRRDLLLKVFPSCALMCAGCTGASAAQKSAQAASTKHKFSEKSEMTYEEIYELAYGGLIPALKNLAEELGKDKFDELLKRAASKAAAQGTKQSAAKLPKADLAAFAAPLKSKNPFWQHVLTVAFVEDTPQAVEIKVTECLWAKTFRAAGAGDLGYALVCHPDFASAPAFNPKMKMTRTKTLMQGHDCCNHRWTLET